MYICLPFTHFTFSFQSTKILNTRLQKISFAHSFCTYHECEVVSDDSASCDSRVEKPNQKVVKFRVLMHFEGDFVFGIVLYIQEKRRLYF